MTTPPPPPQSQPPRRSSSSSEDGDKNENSTSATQTSENQEASMKKIPSIDPSRASHLASNLQSILSRIQKSSSSAAPKALHPNTTPRLVAVSKLKPASDILSLYSKPTSHQHFGENYVQELLEKSRLLPSGIKWHFIGQLQSNKCVQLARDVRGLWAVESVDSRKKAERLEKGWNERKNKTEDERDGEDKEDNDNRLRVFVQVNTSGEDNKAGVDPPTRSNEDSKSECIDLCRFIQDECPNLKLQGLMTIGAIARSQATTPENENEDFVCLREARDVVAQALGVENHKLELSMGMSEDFEGAIKQGSSEVRVGSTIFGERPPKKEASVLGN